MITHNCDKCGCIIENPGYRNMVTVLREDVPKSWWSEPYESFKRTEKELCDSCKMTWLELAARFFDKEKEAKQ